MLSSSFPGLSRFVSPLPLVSLSDPRSFAESALLSLADPLTVRVSLSAAFFPPFLRRSLHCPLSLPSLFPLHLALLLRKKRDNSPTPLD